MPPIEKNSGQFEAEASRIRIVAKAKLKAKDFKDKELPIKEKQEV
jgi:hypothetical protein